MKKSAKKSQILSLITLGTVLSLLFVFFGAPFLRVLRSNITSLSYWLVGAVLSFGLALLTAPSAGFILASIWLCVGLYTELEFQGQAGKFSAFLCVLFSSAVMMLGPYFWAQAQGLDLANELTLAIDQFFKNQKANINAGKESNLTGSSLIKFVPSWIFLIQLCILAFALMMEKRIAKLMNVKLVSAASKIRLLELKLPDWLVWIAMFSFLFSFIKVDITDFNVIFGNIFICIAGLYLFQGLAVLETGLLLLGVGPIIKFLIYFLIVGQLFFLLSVFGFIDYWLDFRRKFRKLKTSSRGHNSGDES